MIKYPESVLLWKIVRPFVVRMCLWGVVAVGARKERGDRSDWKWRLKKGTFLKLRWKGERKKERTDSARMPTTHPRGSESLYNLLLFNGLSVLHAHINWLRYKKGKGDKFRLTKPAWDIGQSPGWTRKLHEVVSNVLCYTFTFVLTLCDKSREVLVQQKSP